MLDFLDNNIAGCISLFVIIILSVWYFKPHLFKDEDNQFKSINVGSYQITVLGLTTIIVAVFVYYLFAIIRYNYIED